MNYSLGLATIDADKITILGTDSYFGILQEDDEVIINRESRFVLSAYNNTEFTVKLPFTEVLTDTIVYVTDKCVWLRYQIQRLSMYILGYDVDLLGVDTVKTGASGDTIQYNTSSSGVSQLIKLRSTYQQELDKCEATKNGTSIWSFRRTETGTF